MTGDQITQDNPATIMRRREQRASTFLPINLDVQGLRGLGFDDFVKAMLKELGEVTRTRRSYYNGIRADSADWVRNSRRFLAAIGALAFLFTGVAAALQVTPGATDWSRAALLLVLVLYAVMGAVAFYERATDKASAYFRHVTIILAMRDLWTKLQFEFLKELEQVNAATDITAAQARARTQILALTEAYCRDVDKLTTGEATEWRAEFQTSLSELEEAARKGSEDVAKRVEDYARRAEKSAADAKASADAATAASQPGQLNLTISGSFEGEVTVLIDGMEVARSTGKAIALDAVRLGPRKITARAVKGGKPLEAAQIIDVKPGIQAVSLGL